MLFLLNPLLYFLLVHSSTERISECYHEISPNLVLFQCKASNNEFHLSFICVLEDNVFGNINVPYTTPQHYGTSPSNTIVRRMYYIVACLEANVR